MEKKLRAAICDTKDMLNEFADYPEASNIVMSAIRLAINKADNMTIDTDLDEELGKLTQAVENARTSVQAQKEAEEQEKKRIAEEEAKKEAIRKQIEELQNKLNAVNAAATKAEEPITQESVISISVTEQTPVAPVAETKPVIETKPVVETKTIFPEPEKPAAVRPQASALKGIEEIRRFYGDEAANKMLLDNQRKAYYVLDDQELSNEALIEKLEQLPTYNRTVEDLGQLKAVSRTPATPKVIGKPTDYPDGTIHF